MTFTMKLIDIKKDTYEAVYGTCELCMSTSMHTDTYFVMDIGGTVYTLETGEWDYDDDNDYFYEWTHGDYNEYFYIENTADFAYWLNTQEFDGDAPKDSIEALRKLRDAVDLYDEYLYLQRTKERGIKYYNVTISCDIQGDELKNSPRRKLIKEVREYLKNDDNLYDENGFYTFFTDPLTVNLPDDNESQASAYSFITNIKGARSLESLKEAAYHIDGMLRDVAKEGTDIITTVEFAEEGRRGGLHNVCIGISNHIA